MNQGAERVVVVARWGAVACALLLAAGRRADVETMVAVAALVALAAVQTVWPSRATTLAALVPAVAVSLTGGWDSPLLPCVLPPVLTVGLAHGFARAAALAAATTMLASGVQWSGESVAWAAELLLVALLAAHARRLEQGTARVHDLEEANRLLTELHGIALGLSMSFEVEEVVTTACERVRSLLAADYVTISLGSEPEGGHTVVLRARDTVVGSMTVVRPAPLSAAERATLADVAVQTALAVDNARRFAHLRTIGAHQERNRIARELHDQLGQDLASLGYMVDMVAMHAPVEMADGLDDLRRSVAYVVRRLRDALADLRADVDAEHDLPSGLADFLARVEERSALRTSLDAKATRRLPPVLERELLRIAEEAVVNAERHADARHVSVRFGATERSAVLEVTDDGIGLPVLMPDRRFGLVGMRERAEAIGADLEIESRPGEGTTVRCRVVA